MCVWEGGWGGGGGCFNIDYWLADSHCMAGSLTRLGARTHTCTLTHVLLQSLSYMRFLNINAYTSTSIRTTPHWTWQSIYDCLSIILRSHPPVTICKPNRRSENSPGKYLRANYAVGVSCPLVIIGLSNMEKF